MNIESLQIYKNSLIDFFLPRFCPGCRLKLKKDDNTICSTCISKIQISAADRLKREYERKFADKEIVTDFFAPFVFEKDKELQHIIHALKYDKKFLVGFYLGKLVAENLLKIKPEWKIDLVIPIPLHQLKKADRGFNQSLYIAKGINFKLKKALSEKIIKRTRYTDSQTGMKLIEREKNIGGAFSIRHRQSIENKSILLIDDVITTGATISECGKILLNAGAEKIYAASVCIAD